MRLDAVPAGARVVVAMSGGVDSSAVAALLHEGGYEVVGITLQLYDHGAAVGRKGACCAGQDIRDARDVAARLGIALAEDRMAILISHRFSTVRMADTIAVLENGSILEHDTHEALLAKGGRYAELFTLQARGYR